MNSPSDLSDPPHGIGWIDRLTERVGKVVGWFLLIMVLLGALNAILGKIGQITHRQLASNTLLEMQWYLFGAVFLFGGAYTLLRDGHVHVDVLSERLSRKTRLTMRLVSHFLLLVPFTLFLVLMCRVPVWQSISELEQPRDPGGLPPYIIKAVLPLAFILLLLQAISTIVRTLRERAACTESVPTKTGGPHAG